MLQFVLALVSAGLESVEEHLEDADNIAVANGYLEGTGRVRLRGPKEAGNSGSDHDREPFGCRPALFHTKLVSMPCIPCRSPVVMVVTAVRKRLRL